MTGKGERLHYDALVVGAGPAGCAAARVLTASGFKVLLVEKERIPRRKPCGGFLSSAALELLRKDFGPLPGDCLSPVPTARGLRLLVEGGGRYDLPFRRPGVSVSRSRLDAFLARKCGAELVDSTEVTDLKVGRFRVEALVRGEGGEERVVATYLVGADGADSLVAGAVRPGFYRLHAAPRLRRTRLLLFPDAGGWDREWTGLFFPRRGGGWFRILALGDMLGVESRHTGEGTGESGETDPAWTVLREAGISPGETSACTTVLNNRMGTQGDYILGAGSALVAGEAAGLLDFWGLGIHLALLSGKAAGEAIVESARENITPHLRYRHRMESILAVLERQRRKPLSEGGELDPSALAGKAGLFPGRDRRLIRKRLARG